VAAWAETPGEDPGERDCVTEFHEGISGRPVGLARGPDSKLWFTEPAEGRLGMLDPETAGVIEFPLPRRSSPRYATFAPDGRLWFTGTNGAIGVFEPASRRARFFTAGIIPGGAPHTPVVLADGGVYFSYENSPKLGRLDIETDAIDAVGRLPGNGGIHGLAVDSSQDALWAARTDTDQLVRFNLQTRRFDRTIRFERGARPHDVAVGSNGRVYTTLQGNGRIGEFDPKTGETHEFLTALRPTATPDQEPDFKLMELAVGEGQDAVWATSFQASVSTSSTSVSAA